MSQRNFAQGTAIKKMADENIEWAKFVEVNRRMNSVVRSGSKEIKEFYDSHAQGFDEEVGALHYMAPKNGVKKLVQFLQEHQFGTDCRILDVGSGTGLVGECLRDLNYTNVDALEPSEKSNEVAKSKGLYKNFIVEFIEPGKQLPIPANTYDAVISIGLFAPVHAKAEGVMDEMVRVVKPGGLICFSIREDVMFDKAFGHEAMMAKLCENNDWRLVSKTQESYFPGYKECYMFVYQVL